MNTVLFEVLTMVAIEDTIFWDRKVKQCVLVEVHRRFGGNVLSPSLCLKNKL